MSRFSHRVGSANSILAALALVGGMFAVLTTGAGARVNTCQVRNLSRGTARSADLQAEIDAANAGDTIQVKRVCVGNFVIKKDLVLAGEPTRSAGKATLDGNGSGGAVLLNDYLTKLTLADLIVTGGSGGIYGGGIVNFGDLTLDRTKVTGNRAGYDGGGIFNSSTFPGTLTLNDSSVRGNSAGMYGGGISNEYGNVTLNNSSVRRNSARYGGGISGNNGIVVLNGSSTVSGNTADNGGGVYNAVGSFILNDVSSVHGNSSRYQGGGISNNVGTVVMSIWSSVSGNIADSDADGQGSGGGIANCGNVPLIGAIEGVNVIDNHLGDGTDNDIVNACP